MAFKFDSKRIDAIVKDGIKDAYEIARLTRIPEDCVSHYL